MILKSLFVSCNGHPRIDNVDEVSAVMLKKMAGEDQVITAKSKIDLSRLPPCRQTLYPHIKRVNYRIAQWKRSNITIFEVPPATEHEWVEISNESNCLMLLYYLPT